MQNSALNFQDAIARAKEIASKLTAAAPNSSLKRTNNDDDHNTKRLAVGSSVAVTDATSPIQRAQMIAQQINSQLGVKPNNELALVTPSQASYQEDYKIPDKFVGLIIGKGGEQIIRLQAESGCKVQICQIKQDPIPGGPNPPDRIANLSGTREAINNAKRIMDDIINRGKMADGAPSGINPYSFGGSQSKSIDVMLPSAKCGLIIGKGGETIRRLNEEFGVKMFVVQETKDIDGIEHKPLRIIGESDRIERAKQSVLESLSRSGPPGAGPNRFGNNNTAGSSTNDYGSKVASASMNGPCNEAIYSVPFEKAGVIIGKGGESIKEINRKSGAYVELDKSQRSMADVTVERQFKLRGTPEQIATAQQLMYEKVANSQGGPGDILTPTQFQAKYNLPAVASSSADPWGAALTDPYASTGSAADFYAQWASAYSKWPQMAGYDDSSAKSGTGAAAAGANASGMDQAAWMQYYQAMNAYMMQSQMGTNAASTGAAATPTTTATTTSAPSASTDSTNNSTSAGSSAAGGQADYSQQWIEYYRSLGQHDLADQIARQLKESSTNGNSNSTKTSSSSSSMNPSDSWAAYAQEWSSSKSNNTPNNSSSSN